MQAAIVYLHRRLPIDSELVAPALGGNVLPMPAVEPAAISEIAAMKDAMQFGLRPTAIIEMVLRSILPGVYASSGFRGYRGTR